MIDTQQPWLKGFTRKEFETGNGTVSWLELIEPRGAAGVPIVLVHGIQGSALEHCELGRRLGGRGPVYLLDLRGHGHSSAAPDNPIAGSMTDQVDVVVAFLREVVGRPAVLIGNSFGAMISARVARTAPELVERLVLIGPAMTPSRVPLKLTRTSQWLLVKSRFVHSRYDNDVRDGKRPEDPDSQLVDAVPDVGLIPTQYLPAPSLWLHGIDDPLMPGMSAQYLRRLLPGWQVHAIAETGHVPHLERVDWTAERIEEWLDRALPTRRAGVAGAEFDVT